MGQLARDYWVQSDQAEPLATPSIIQVLVAEDYEPFRRFLLSTLQNVCGVADIRMVSDGLEAVREAKRIQPDLILLDIGLPSLNGLEAARQIRKLCPISKIIFVTLESSADVVQEAFRIGARGYVVKAQAGSELIAAVEAVRQGRLFVSAGVAGHKFTDAMDGQVPDRLCHEEASPPLVPKSAEITPSHAVQFYSDDALFLDGFRRFFTAALKAGNAVIIVATESHRASLLQRLQAGGVDVAAAIERKRYIAIDVPDSLPPVQFAKAVNDLVVEAAKAAGGEHLRVAAG